MVVYINRHLRVGNGSADNKRRRNRRHAGRKRAAGLLARATTAELEPPGEALPAKPEVQPVRGPETGLVMVRGRIGGGGAPFNLGEATVTRATVRLGIRHRRPCAGARHRPRQGGLAAIFDALWQEDATADSVETDLARPDRSSGSPTRRSQKAEETAATRVDFFTMVRGDD